MKLFAIDTIRTAMKTSPCHKKTDLTPADIFRMKTNQTASAPCHPSRFIPGVKTDGRESGFFDTPMKTYAEKRKDPRWTTFREKAFDCHRRDCQNCGQETDFSKGIESKNLLSVAVRAKRAAWEAKNSQESTTMKDD